jgi:catechol 2,3-dioxygenase-like lactoylglutathione lyase family enzyme
MDLEFSELDVNVLYWQASFYFYAKVLGMEMVEKDGRRAALRAGHVGAGGLTFALNSGGRFPGYRVWGTFQGVRPSIQVEDLQAVAERARRSRVIFTGREIEEKSWGRRMEFTAPEMIRWTLSEVPGAPMSDDLSRPVIGHVEIRVNDLAAQTAFYCDALGFRIEDETATEATLRQGEGKPWVTLELAGGKQENPPTWAKEPERAHPVVMGLAAADLRAAAERARRAGGRVLKDSEAAGGERLVLADPDGNAVRIRRSG